MHLEPANSISSVYVDVSGMPIDELMSQVSEVGLGWEAFPIRVSADGTLARIAGPQSYVTQVENVVQRLVDARRNRPERVRRSLQPRMYFGGRSAATQGGETAPTFTKNEEN